MSTRSTPLPNRRRVVRRRDLEHATADVAGVRADEALDVDAVDRRPALEAPVRVDRRDAPEVAEIGRAPPAPLDEGAAHRSKPAADTCGYESSPAGQGRDIRAAPRSADPTRPHRRRLAAPRRRRALARRGDGGLGARGRARRAPHGARMRSGLDARRRAAGTRRAGHRDRGRVGARAARGGPPRVRAPRRDAALAPVRQRRLRAARNGRRGARCRDGGRRRRGRGPGPRLPAHASRPRLARRAPRRRDLGAARIGRYAEPLYVRRERRRAARRRSAPLRASPRDRLAKWRAIREYRSQLPLLGMSRSLAAARSRSRSRREAVAWSDL